MSPCFRMDVLASLESYERQGNYVVHTDELRYYIKDDEFRQANDLGQGPLLIHELFIPARLPTDVDPFMISHLNLKIL